MQPISGDPLVGSFKDTTPLSQPDLAKSKIANVVDKYMQFCHEVSTSGKKETYQSPPLDTIAKNCQRIFNGKLEEQTGADFIKLLENFFASNGPWVIKVKERHIDPATNNVDMTLTIKISNTSYSEKLRLHLNDELKIDKVIADMKPKATLEVGMDDYVPTPAPQLDRNNFEEFFNFTSEQRNEFHQKALTYYQERFGVDTSGAEYDEKTGITKGNGFMVYPIKCGGSYEVTKSRTDQLPAGAKIRIAEFVLVFTPEAKGKPYGGSYASEQVKEPTAPTEIDPSHSLSFGMYRLLEKDGKHHDIAMQSLIPNHPISKEGHVLVKLALDSKEFGKGEGAFVAQMDMEKPSKGDLYRAYVKGSWHFPSVPYSKKT